MQTITFYSYKGGVGRTLALANTARMLAKRGRKVFVLDLDLEAPGLHFKLLTGAERSRIKRGFVDLAYDYFLGDEGVHVSASHPVTEYIQEVPSSEGKIWLMPAGDPSSEEYWKRMAGLQWSSRFRADSSEGFLFFLELKRRIEEECAPDVLLIDARTGVTEIGGVALTLLPDQVVCFFVNNAESIEGTREIIRSIPRSMPTGESPPGIVAVLTRIPAPVTTDSQAEEEKLRARCREELNERHPGVEAPTMERVLVLHSDRELELREELYLGGVAEKLERVLYADYLELFRALPLLPAEVLRSLEIDARAQAASEAARRGDTNEAVVQQQKALNAAETVYGTRHIKYAETLHDYTRVLSATERRAEALELMHQLDALYSALGAANVLKFRELPADIVLLSATLERFDNVSTRLDAALRYYRQLRHDQPIGFLIELRNRYEAGKGRYDSSYGLVLRELWRALLSAGHDVDAEAVLEAAIPVFGKLGDEGRLELAGAQQALANVQMKRGDHAQAEVLLLEAQNAYSASLDAEDPRVLEVREALAVALRAQGRELGAEAVIQRGKTVMPVERLAPPERLPERRPRLVRAGHDTLSFSLHLAVITPILGGATSARTIDQVDVIRVPSLRGQLRFWWRALYAGQLSGEALYLAERRLWGGAGDDDGGRSQVELRVTVKAAGDIDTQPMRQGTSGAYALWPARETRGDNPQDTAPRRLPGTRFVVHLRCPKNDETAVRSAVRALLLFGGYGSRTRRGAGSFTLDLPSDRAEWLPAEATREALTALFGEDVLAPLAGRVPDDLPLLRGAGLRAGAVVPDASDAWTTALGWLSDFRQRPSLGGAGDDPWYARARGDAGRPGRSNWPEADKVRRLSGASPWAHEPRHNGTPVWPRAGFGLPIVARFQRKDRSGTPYARREPADYEIRWYEEERGERIPHDRLASPLIVKALPLADGSFVPCALWLHRGYPDGKVGLKEKDSRAARSHAEFDLLVAPGDQARFEPLRLAKDAPKGMRLRKAFFGWLEKRPKIVVVAP